MKNITFALLSAAAVLLLSTIAVVSIASPDNALAYKKNQADSQTSACGNNFFPINIGCHNTDSQIQGDKNSVALTAQQTFPEIVEEEPPTTPEPQTCEECFTEFLTAEQLETFEETLQIETPNIISIEDLCAA